MPAASWTGRIVLELGVTIGTMGLADALGWWALYPAAFIIGTRAHALLILGHIGAHRLNGCRSAKLSDFVTRWLAMGAAGMDLDRYRRFHAMHHTFIGEPGRDPEVEVVRKFPDRWTHGYRWQHTAKDMLGLHSDEMAHLIRSMSSRRAYVVPAILFLLALALAPIGAAAFLLSPYVGAITVHRLRSWTEHDHFRHPGYTYTMDRPALWRRVLYLPHLQWQHAEHHGGLTMPKPFARASCRPGRRLLRILVHVRNALRMLALIVLTAAVWLVLAYVCGRQAMMITEEGARMLMRQVLPGIS